MTTPTELSQSNIPSFRSRWEPRDIAPLISLAVLVLFFTIAIPRFQFLRLGTLEIILRQAAVLAIVSVGLTFVLLCGEIDLSVGHMALWTACFCGVLLKKMTAAGTAPSVGIVALCIGLPVLSSLALGFCSGVLTVTSKLPSFIITLAMMNIANGLAKYLTKSEKFAVPEILEWFGNRGISLGQGVSFPYNTFLAAVIMIAGHIVLTHTRFGRYVYMTGGNREAARLAGVRTHWIVVSCLAISAVTAGLGGLLNAGRMNAVSLDQNADLLLNAVACVVLGGTSLFGGEGSMGRTVIGVLTFSVLQVGLNQINWINDFMRPFLMGVVLMCALVLNGFLAQRRVQ